MNIAPEQWGKDVAAELSAARAEIERLRAALAECGAPFLSRPCTMAEAPEIVGREFQRRMDIAAAALNASEQSTGNR